MRENYRTVARDGEAEMTIQKSRFIGYAKRVETEAEALEFIHSIKQLHKSATHNCSAYMIGEHDSIQKANDDGEPSGTAGVPILEVIKKQRLKDTAIVVTRYFGGIKLGGGGLIRAYGKGATIALEAAGIVERRLHHLMQVTIDYTWLGKVENEVRQSAYPLHDILYTDGVSILLHVPTDELEAFSAWMMELTNGQASIENVRSDFLEFPAAD